MKFDGNRAWKQAARWVSANRDVLVALAGVFFLLPGLVASLFGPVPATPTAGMTAEQIVAITRTYYAQSLPYLLPTVLLQALGTLAMLTLLTDGRRPTVGQSIRHGLTGVVPYILAQVLLALGLGLIGGVVALAAGLTGAKLLLVVAIGVVAAIVVYIVVRTSLSGPVIAVEGMRNPVNALARSWRLTQGHAPRMLLFYLTVGLLFAVIATVLRALVGIILALLLSRAGVDLVLAVIGSVVGAVATTYFIAILGAVHRQIAGPALADQRATFE